MAVSRHSVLSETPDGTKILSTQNETSVPYVAIALADETAFLDTTKNAQAALNNWLRTKHPKKGGRRE